MMMMALSVMTIVLLSVAVVGQNGSNLPIGNAQTSSTEYHNEPYLALKGSNYKDITNTSSLQLTKFSISIWFKTSTNFGSNAYSNGQWHYAVATYYGATSTTLRLWIDGVQVSSKSTTAIPDNTGTQPIRLLGANSLSINGFFIGNVDEVRVWKRGLSSQEVSDTYNKEIFNEDGQILHLNFGTNNTVNQPPIANTGQNQIVNEDVKVTLDGTVISDLDDNLPLTYSWVHTGDTNNVTLNDPNTANPTFTAPNVAATEDSLIFSLTVKDSKGLASTSPDSVTITVKDKPSQISLIGTFYYPWYGKYRHWVDNGHNPPTTWASNYLPDIDPTKFNPSVELYDNNNNATVVKQQLGWMKEAGIQFVISSWWGQNSYEDIAFGKILNNVMPAADNPNPNLNWTIYYEQEGFGDPTVTQLISDLNYIKTKYAASPSYMKINGKPVIFVYNAAHTGYDPLNDFDRWKQARAQTGFFVVMKVDPLSKGVNQDDMDGWHQYAPAIRYDQQGIYSAMVSPGFWKYHEAAARLVRNVADFESAVSRMASANVQFKLVETWNEWGEGTGVEPAQQIVHNDASTFQPAAPSYDKTYLNILGKYLSGTSNRASKVNAESDQTIVVSANSSLAVGIN